jgi:hypothetical protein
MEDRRIATLETQDANIICECDLQKFTHDILLLEKKISFYFDILTFHKSLFFLLQKNFWEFICLGIFYLLMKLLSFLQM